MKHILALDLSNEIAWAIRPPDGGLIHGVDSFRSKQVPTSGIRFLRFRRYLAELCDATKVQAIVFVESSAAAHRPWIPHLKEFCARTGTPLHSVSPGAVKKHIAGRGTASREDILTAVKARGHEPGSTAEAAAIATLLFAERERENV